MCMNDRALLWVNSHGLFASLALSAMLLHINNTNIIHIIMIMKMIIMIIIIIIIVIIIYMH